jgi:hypothetical protein
MTKTPMVEMSEGTYATLWNAIVKTNDKDSLSLFKEVIHSESVNSIPYYTMAKDLLLGFIGEIEKSGNLKDANMILKNAHKSGYFRKYYTFN